ncbi:DUF3846 domain-containing protein [Kineosporia sp. J2-2]|uniref:DUF3846 domain-containing protein n=1 Tax=Kineosporia corallincola TaxID=2835133 RepID=A0ABS5TTN4_9ACTN|nr:DUF3846 domain-containing protein [Kineosporia corallincola]MBT0774169.1 DUF3846 domain-containing protein [Kineosporia corallincola]
MPENRHQTQREPLLAIVIPADDEQPVRIETLPRGIVLSRNLLGLGHDIFQVVNLDQPAASLYCNEEGKILGLEPNRRATLLGIVHNPGLRGDVIAGDAFIVGPPVHGDDTTAPIELIDVIAHQGLLQVQRSTNGEPGTWEEDALFTSWTHAYQHLERFTTTHPVRVVATTDPATFWRWLLLDTHSRSVAGVELPARPTVLACRSVDDLAEHILYAHPRRQRTFGLRGLAIQNRAPGDGQDWVAVDGGRVTPLPPLRQAIASGAFPDLIRSLHRTAG